MKKNILSLVAVLLFVSCNQSATEKCTSLEKSKIQVETNINTYKTAWDVFFDTRDSGAINTQAFDEDVTVITASGKITGIDEFRAYYANYLTGFSDAEFTFVDVFGQGDKLVKHWNFKGTHDGEMFGIAATNKKVNISGTTLVLMKNGKVMQEQDFFDNHSFLMQLGLLK